MLRPARAPFPAPDGIAWHDVSMGREAEGVAWTATYIPAGEERSAEWRMSIKKMNQRAERERQRMESRFRKAPFPLYGLPASWEGGRFLGGVHWSGKWWREAIQSLSLVHGVLVEGEGPMLVVESARSDEPGGGGPLRILAEELWGGRAKTVPEAVAILRARWRGLRDVDLSPLPSRTEAPVRVAGSSVRFDVLSQPGHWVARTAIGGCQLTIEGHGFPLGGLELVEVTDLQPYILGSRRFRGGAQTEAPRPTPRA